MSIKSLKHRTRSFTLKLGWLSGYLFVDWEYTQMFFFLTENLSQSLLSLVAPHCASDIEPCWLDHLKTSAGTNFSLWDFAYLFQMLLSVWRTMSLTSPCPLAPLSNLALSVWPPSSMRLFLPHALIKFWTFIHPRMTLPGGVAVIVESTFTFRNWLPDSIGVAMALCCATTFAPSLCHFTECWLSVLLSSCLFLFDLPKFFYWRQTIGPTYSPIVQCSRLLCLTLVDLCFCILVYLFVFLFVKPFHPAWNQSNQMPHGNVLKH